MARWQGFAAGLAVGFLACASVMSSAILKRLWPAKHKRQNRTAMAKDAYYFLIPLAVLALFSFWGGLFWVMICVLTLAVFVAFFFRDPERSIPEDPRAIVSPADGRIIRLDRDGENSILSIFLSVFDVHVNRAPIAGTIVKQDYRPGNFNVAYNDRASVENECLVITIADQKKLTFSLIAGIVARRIRVWKKEGEHVNKGDRIGLIRFGSRVDIFLPPDSHLVVRQGDQVYAGASIIAYWKNDS